MFFPAMVLSVSALWVFLLIWGDRISVLGYMIIVGLSYSKMTEGGLVANSGDKVGI